MSAAIQSYQIPTPQIKRDLIRIKYLNIEYTAWRVTAYFVNEDTVSIEIGDHVEIAIDGDFINVEIGDTNLEIIGPVSITGNTTYEGDVTIVDSSRIRFGTTINGDTVYAVITTNEDGSIRVDWFNMDGSPYTGDVTTITIVNEENNNTIQVFQRYTQIDAVQNIWLTFLEVLVLNAEGSLIFQNYISYGGVNLVFNSNFVITEAPVSVQINDVYQVSSDNDTNIEVNWDSSQYFSDNDVIGVTINIKNTVNRVAGVKVYSIANLTLNNTTEIVNNLGIKTYVDMAPVGRRCGTKPKVKLERGAKMTCNIQREKAPQVVREPGPLAASSLSN